MPLPDPIKGLNETTQAARSLWTEFKAFALKGNMLDLAVAVVLGAAFGNVINALVKHIIMPALSYVIPNEGGYRNWMIGRVEVGVFLGELVNFFTIAFALFVVLVKFLGTIQKATSQAAAAAPTTKECPFCISVIPIKARKCGHCTADLPEPTPPATTASLPPSL